MTIKAPSTVRRAPVTVTGETDPAVIAVAAPYGPPGPTIAGTSLTSNSIGIGAKTFVLEEYGRMMIPGTRIRATANAAPANFMEGVVTTFSSRTVTFTSDYTKGAGTFSDWNINVAGEPGEKGDTGPIGPSGPVPEAPSDSKHYARYNATWIETLPKTLIDSADAARILKSGDTMTGPLVLPVANPTLGTHAAHKAYVDSVATGGTVPNARQVIAGAGLIGGGDMSADRTFNVGAGNGIAVDADAVRLVVPVALANGGTGGTTQQTARQGIYAAPFDAMGYFGMQVNGAFAVAQETVGGAAQTISAAGTSMAYLCDVFQISTNVTGTAWQANQTGLLGTLGNALFLNCTGANGAPAAGNAAFLITHIEADRISRLAWGSASAAPITIGFYINCNTTGVIALSIRNSDFTRSYVTLITINAASAWEYKTVTIPGDQAGSWLTAPGSLGLRLTFGLCVGANFNAPAQNAWQAGNYISIGGALNLGGSVGRQVYIADLFVLPGNEAPSAVNVPNALRSFDAELDLVKRYWRKSYEYATAYATATQRGCANVLGLCNSATAIGGFGIAHNFDRPMRTVPTVVVFHPDSGAIGSVKLYSSAGVHTGSASLAGQSENGFQMNANGVSPNLTPATPAEIIFQYAANARFT